MTLLKHGNILLVVLLFIIAVAFAAYKLLKPTVKVGVLHSLTGNMVGSESILKEAALMTFDEINKEGGVLGRKIEAIVKDPASNWPLAFICGNNLSRKRVRLVSMPCAKPWLA